MTHLLIDTSVVIKWFHDAGESEVEAARAVLAAHLTGDVQAHVLDLAAYEVGNVLIRSLGWPPRQTADQLAELDELFGPAISLTPSGFRDAATLADAHGLSFYDSCWGAAAREVGVVLVSADLRLQSAGLAESPTQTVTRLRLT